MTWKEESHVIHISEADFRKQIKTDPQKCYLLFGEEEYMKNYALEQAISALSPDPTLAFFNEIRLDPLSYSPEALLNAIMAAPMMADRKLIILQNIDFNAMKKENEVDALLKALDALDEYDYNTVIIVVASDRIDVGKFPKKPSAILERLGEHATLVNFERNTPARLCSWLSKHFAHNGVFAEPSVCMALIDRCGRDMYTLASETDKLCFYVLQNGRNTVTVDDVNYVAITAVEYDTYAFSNAIAARRREQALQILYDMKNRRMDPILIMGELSKAAGDMLCICLLSKEGVTAAEISKIIGKPDFAITRMLQTLPGEDVCRQMVEKCRAADREVKNFGDGYAAIERLVCTL